MIQIKEISIDHVRGIKHFNRELNLVSLAIQGPNGSGKSGVVDAVEFGLTGKFSRLKGLGTKSLTVKEHGKHVDADVGKVTLTLFVPSQNREIVVTRTTKNPSKPKIEPNDELANAIVSEIAGHPEIALTRRQIIRFILAESKDRSKELQALLRLDKVQSTCDELRKANAQCSKASQADQQLLSNLTEKLRTHLGVSEITEANVLAVVNQHRSTVGLSPLPDLDSFLSPAADQNVAAKQEVNKQNALAEVQAIRDAIADDGISQACSQIISQLDTLDSDPTLAIALARHQLIGFGLEALDADECPLCDKEWELDKLKQHLIAKQAQSEAAKAINDAIEKAASTLSLALTTIGRDLRNLGMIAKRLSLPDHISELKAAYEKVSAWTNDLKTQAGIASGRTWISSPLKMNSISAAVEALAEMVNQLPEQSATEHSRTFLAEAKRQLSEHKQAKVKSAESERIAELAKRTHAAYQQTSEAVLNELYNHVKADFEHSYRFINEEDESDFESEFNTSENSLEIKAKFYSHGIHPPAAYHSEGHQDGMGICLYLALMKHVFGGDLKLVILDDVVMSIDNGHRKKLCELLRTKFPDTQFIITTHERTWFKQMQTAKLIDSKSAIQFSGWTVDHGPQVFTAESTWDEIEAALQKNDIGLAAWRLRNHLECLSSELADDLGADVVYRADGSHSVGELFPRVCQRFRKLLKQSAKASKSWGHVDKEEETSQLESRFKDLVTRIEEQESWMVNPAVHHNPWQDFTRQEFTQVVKAYRELLDCLTCQGCKTTVRRNSPVKCTEISCMCGCLQFRLVEATATQKAERIAAEATRLRLHAQ